MTPYKPKPSSEVVTASKRSAIREALLELLIKEKKTEIIIQCGLRALDHLDKALRSARNVIVDIDPTVEKCDCCY